MYKNYFFLNRFIIEANKELAGSDVVNIFTQEKDKLVIELKSNVEEKFLEISVNPGFPYLHLRRSFHRAKKNTITIFEEIIPEKINSFQISLFDRIIRINLNTSSIYFSIRGKFTNVHLVDPDGNIFSFKKTDEEIEKKFIEEISKTEFISHYELPELDLRDETDLFSYIKSNYPFIGKEILSEAKTRSENGNNFVNKIIEVIKDVESASPALYSSEGSVELAFDKFNLFKDYEKKLFDDISTALSTFITKKYQNEFISDKKKIIEKHLDRELNKISSKLNKLKGRIDKGSKENSYFNIANLLLINRGNIYKGMGKIELNNPESGEIISVKLNPAHSVQKNIDNYFDKSKSERINFEKSKELYKNISDQYRKLLNIKESFNSAETKEDYEYLMKELKLKKEEPSSPRDELKDKFKQYLIEGKYSLFVGKDSVNNDLLTTKFAKQNDYWFHARSVPGSHVVLRVDNTKEAVPKSVLKKAAAIAAYHSKSKTSGMAPVSYALKKYVVKKKGMEAGKVALMKEDVLLVKPEIPADCEYISADMK